MRVLILSAGLGERLRPLTLKRAKPAIEFLNIPMLGFPYYWMKSAGLSEVTFNTHYLPESIRHAAMHVVSPETPMHFLHEDHILGSGGGIRNARVYLEGDDHFGVANGDGVVLCEDPATLQRMLDFHVKRDALATFLVCPLEGVGTRLPGVWMDNTGEVMNFGKDRRASFVDCFHFASFMFFSKRVWDYLPDGPSNILYDVIEPRIAEGEKVYGFRVDGMRWYETGNVPDYLRATRDCLELIREGGPLGRSARSIVETLAPAMAVNTDFERLRLIADSATIDGDIEGFTVIGNDCTLERGARIEGGVMLPGSRLPAGEALKDDVRI